MRGGGASSSEQIELLEKQAEAIRIAEELGPRYRQIRQDDDRCERALLFIQEHKGKILPFNLVFEAIKDLNASSHLTAFVNDGIMAVEAALHSLHDPEMGLNLAKRQEDISKEVGKHE